MAPLLQIALQGQPRSGVSNPCRPGKSGEKTRLRNPLSSLANQDPG